MSDTWEPTLNQRKFVAALAKMVAPMQSAEASAALLAMLPALKYLPDAVFDRPGELAVQIGVEFSRVPTLAQLRKTLDIWWSAQKPQRPALPGADPDMPLADREIVRFWGEYRAGTRTLPRGVTLDTWLDMSRRPTPEAFRYLVKTDEVARGIAEKHNWIPVPREPAPDASANLQAVKASLAAAEPETMREERALTTPSAVPPEALAPAPVEPTVGEQFEAVHGRKLGALTPEQLEELRKQAGIKFPAKRPEGSRPYVPRPPANDSHPDPTPPSGGPFPWSIGGGNQK